MFLPQETIRRKRDGLALSAAEIAAFIQGLTNETISDAQVGAFAMAVLLRGMTTDETVALTLAMRDSGKVLDWRAFGVAGPIVDKHSTGGIGDKTSLILGPILAACGATVPMISGRGLGHSGGTLDKLEAIPGYRATVDQETFARVVRDVGIAIVGATADLAPADRRLYRICRAFLDNRQVGAVKLHFESSPRYSTHSILFRSRVVSTTSQNSNMENAMGCTVFSL